MITLSDPTGKKKDPKGYEKVLMKTLGDRYGSVPQDKIDSFNKIISGGSLLENREEVSNALRYLVDNYGMSTDSLTKNIIDYNIEQKILGTLGSMAERAKIMAGMKVMGYKTGGALGENGDPTQYMQPEMSRFMRGDSGAAQFNDDYNEILRGLMKLRDSASTSTDPKPEPERSNYLNLAKLDSIIESQHEGKLPFSNFRDAVRRAEAGPNSPDPYRQRQEGEVLRDGKMATLPVGVGRGAYQFDYPTAQTAYTRLKSIANKRNLDYPKLSDEDLMDVRRLSPEIQDMLFTAHFAKDTATSVADVLDDESKYADQYQIGHYKGKKDRRPYFRSLQ